MTPLGRSRIVQFFRALDLVLASKGATADIYLVDSAAMAVGFDAERSTRDVDAVFAPTTVVRDAAAVVAEEVDLPSDWLNDAVKGFVPSAPDVSQRVVFESDHLRVCSASAEYLLAMKVAASRVEQDRRDLEILIHALGITSAEQAMDVARASLGPSYPIPPRAQYLVEEIFDA